ncbi:protein adenylyltransferase SelO [Photobacterium kagoshimensis]|uniref:protein adenylyltransferase SelO n=1 Tax=Photobacterium kagoshimensis TaxID=2910242 RepID=UPI003D121EFB
MTRTLDQLVFNNSFRQLPPSFYTQVIPQPLSEPFLVSFNPYVCQLLELSHKEVTTDHFAQIFTGNGSHPKFEPIAMKYTGHQFGQYNPDLGDGRGVLLGEVVTSTGTKWDLHLKGSGLTPYSRQGDGRAVLRSSIREYLASAAMAGLGIKTTHALAIFSSTTPVYREKVEQGATLIRVAESHVRFGHFEYLFYTQQHGDLKQLADYIIEHHFSDLSAHSTPYAAMYQRIVELTATLIADWQSVGFAHGVMNTDNMSVLGLTFDYGPYGFLDDYNPNYICNHSDYSGRYAFNQQPSIALWNLAALGYALSPLIESDTANAVLDTFEPLLQTAYSKKMRAKLGLVTHNDQDGYLFKNLFNCLTVLQLDYTLFFRTLSSIPVTDIASSADRLFAVASGNTSLNTEDTSTESIRNKNKKENQNSEHRAQLATWLNEYQQRVILELIDSQAKGDNKHSDQDRQDLMLASNPKYTLRNYLAQLAIQEAEQGDYSRIESLMEVLASPFDEHPKYQAMAQLPPEWGKTLTISCSS